jgi:hypothetical protein
MNLPRFYAQEWNLSLKWKERLSYFFGRSFFIINLPRFYAYWGSVWSIFESKSWPKVNADANAKAKANASCLMNLPRLYVY